MFLGFGLATKVNALFVLLVYVAATAASTYCRGLRESLPEYLRLFILFLASAAISTYVSWPVLWVDPMIFPESVVYFTNYFVPNGVEYTLYMGGLYRVSELPWHYAPIMLAAVSPAATLITSAVGLAVGLYAARKGRLLEYVVVLSWLLMPLFAEMKPGIVRYHGIRQFLVVVPAVAVLAGSGLFYITLGLRRLSNRFGQYAASLVVLLAAVSLFSEALMVHPYGGSYYNEFVRFLVPSHIEDYFEFDYWGQSYREGFLWLNENAKDGSTVYIPYFGHYRRFYPINRRLNYTDNIKSDYVMSVTHDKGKTVLDEVSRLPQYRLVYSVSRFNSDLMRIYEGVNITLGKD